MGLAFPKPTPHAPKPRKPLARTSWMKAGKPPQRKTRLRQRSAKRTRVVDVERRDWCRRQPCSAGGKGFGPCTLLVDPHHAGKKPGLGKKAPEHTLVPLCRKHHDDITGVWGGYGVFQRLGEEGRRKMQDAWIADACAKYAAHGGRRGP